MAPQRDPRHWNSGSPDFVEVVVLDAWLREAFLEDRDGFVRDERKKIWLELLSRGSGRQSRLFVPYAQVRELLGLERTGVL